MGADATEGKDIVININLILVTAEYWHTLENLSARWRYCKVLKVYYKSILLQVIIESLC